MDMLKMCVICKGIKPPAEFYKDKRMKGGLSFECKPCKRTRSAAYQRGEFVPREEEGGKKKRGVKPRVKTNADPKLRQREKKLKANYGVSLDDYETQFLLQEGKCAICGIECPLLHVDHCHNGKGVRGLLCPPCNMGIGFLKDNVETLKNAITYLEGDGVWGKVM